jgi:hypothetical protein
MVCPDLMQQAVIFPVWHARAGRLAGLGPLMCHSASAHQVGLSHRVCSAEAAIGEAAFDVCLLLYLLFVYCSCCWACASVLSSTCIAVSVCPHVISVMCGSSRVPFVKVNQGPSSHPEKRSCGRLSMYKPTHSLCVHLLCRHVWPELHRLRGWLLVPWRLRCAHQQLRS